MLSSALLAILTSLIKRKRSRKNILNKSGHKMEPWGNRKSKSLHGLKESFILVLCFLLAEQFWIRFNTGRLNPYALSLAIIRSCGRQSKAFERSVRRAPKTFLLSTAFFHFSNMAIRQCWAWNPFRKRQWYLDRNWSMNGVICLHNSFSKILERTGRILTGR